MLGEAVRRWLARLGRAPGGTRGKAGKHMACATPTPIKLPENFFRRTEKLYDSMGKMAKPSLPVPRKPLKARQALSLLNPNTHLLSH